MSTEPGSMLTELEAEVFPTGGTRPACIAPPPELEVTVILQTASELMSDVPDLTPAASPDPIGLAGDTADAAMPIIDAYYAPPSSVDATTFMGGVSVKDPSYADDFQVSDAAVGEFLAWYSGENATLRALLEPYCGITEAWWTSLVGRIRGTFVDNWFQIIERARLFDTYNTTVAGGGEVEIGLAFVAAEIPHTVVHEAMHLYEHPDMSAQIDRLEDIRSSKDIFTEGFAEYLARAVVPQVVDKMMTATPAPLTAAEAADAKTIRGYEHYVDQAVKLRDILYAHGQDGEEALRRAFFHGEGWRFGLLERPGEGSPIESDRAVPATVDVHFDSTSSTIKDPAALDAAIDYIKGRGVSRVEVVGRTDRTGTDPDNDRLGLERAEAVKTHLEAAGIDGARITPSTRGERDQIPGGRAANRRATVTVIDPRNEFGTRRP